MKTFLKEQSHLLLAGVWAFFLAMEVVMISRGTRSVLSCISAVLDVALIVLNLLIWRKERQQ